MGAEDERVVSIAGDLVPDNPSAWAAATYPRPQPRKTLPYWVRRLVWGRTSDESQALADREAAARRARLNSPKWHGSCCTPDDLTEGDR